MNASMPHRAAAGGSRSRPAHSRIATGAVLLALALSASGCTTLMSAQVTTFHREDGQLLGKRFDVQAKEGQASGLEFDAYAQQVRAALAAAGLVPADAASAQLHVRIGYGVDEPRAVAVERPVYGYAQFGPVWSWQPYYGPGGVVHYAWGPGWPVSYGVVGSTYGQYRVWRHRLEVDITAASPDATRLYEGRASTQARTDALPTLMPVLVHALFKDFPGPNGDTRVVDVEVREARPQARPAAPTAAPPSGQSTRSQ
ncbi:MAG: DUF4136 domain-containing protein [Lautropia sp.]